MKRDVTKRAGRFRGWVMAIVAVMLLSSPSSTSILCIAPGGHVAVESIDSTCCAVPRVVPQDDNWSNKISSEDGNCKNCIDIFIEPNGKIGIVDFRNHVDPNQTVHAVLEDHILPDASISAHQPRIARKLNALGSISSSIPLRC